MFHYAAGDHNFNPSLRNQHKRSTPPDTHGPIISGSVLAVWVTTTSHHVSIFHFTSDKWIPRRACHPCDQAFSLSLLLSSSARNARIARDTNKRETEKYARHWKERKYIDFDDYSVLLPSLAWSLVCSLAFIFSRLGATRLRDQTRDVYPLQSQHFVLGIRVSALTPPICRFSKTLQTKSILLYMLQYMGEYFQKSKLLLQFTRFSCDGYGSLNTGFAQHPKTRFDHWRNIYSLLSLLLFSKC